jgi:PAS domain-containing protein
VKALRWQGQKLDRELALTKEFLQTTLEEKESATEELKSANEELQSSNEELQSTNEELETSKEEMQSTNEELTTVNEELQNRMAELSQTNDDLYNVLAGVENAVIIVGLDLRIRRFTAAAERLFNLVPADVGRAVDFLDPFLGAGALGPKVSSVVESLAVIEEEVLARNQRWYQLRVSPYKTLDHAIRGALIMLVQIDVRKRAAIATRDAGDYATRFLAAAKHPLLMIDRKLRIVWANEGFFATFQLSAEETIGNLLPSIGPQSWLTDDLRALLDTAFTAGTMFRDHRAEDRASGCAQAAREDRRQPDPRLVRRPAGPGLDGAGDMKERRVDRMTRDQLVRELENLEGAQRRLAVGDGSDASRARHDLQVHQVELEMQNRELRETQGLLEESRSRYAPISTTSRRSATARWISRGASPRST